MDIENLEENILNEADDIKNEYFPEALKKLTLLEVGDDNNKPPDIIEAKQNIAATEDQLFGNPKLPFSIITRAAKHSENDEEFFNLNSKPLNLTPVFAAAAGISILTGAALGGVAIAKIRDQKRKRTQY